MKYVRDFFMMVCTIALLSSCSSNRPMFKQSYYPSKSAVSKLNYDDTWSKVIDFFSENSIPISVIDKNSGIITANSVNIGESLVTCEDKNGKPVNPNAWFIMPYIKGCVGGQAICGFNVRVKPPTDDNDEVVVSVNLAYSSGKYTKKYFDTLTFKTEYLTYPLNLPCVSTGKFEEDLLNQFTK